VLPIWIKVWRDFLEKGLSNGKFKVAPEPTVLEGLEKLQDALDLYRKGVSAGKIVVSL
jgi:hypothetical protein